MESKNENGLNVPSEKNFVLSKVKIVKDGGLDVHFEVAETVNNESYVNKYHVESAKDIHPDLRACFVELRPIVGRIFNLTSFLSMIEADDFGANDKQDETARNYADELLKKIEVLGIRLSGQDDNVGVVVTALLEVSMNAQKSAINTPRIKFANVNYGFEEELEDIVSRIENEVYLFLFKGKKAQLELFGADGTAAPEIKKDEQTDMFPDVDDPANETDTEDENEEM